MLRALELCDAMGQKDFLARHGFQRSRRYHLVHDGRSYDSKAVAGVAFGLQHPQSGTLLSHEFSGGTSGAALVLERLGFTIVDLQRGGRAGADRRRAAPARLPQPEPAPQVTEPHLPPVEEDGAPGALRVVLVGCVKSKQPVRAPAAELYTSALFRKRRAYAQDSGSPWFILSAQHGLVEPDQVLEPYDLALKDQSVEYRTSWGRHVIRALTDRLGPLDGMTLEVHAGVAYADALRAPAQAHGARLLLPLRGLSQGQQLAWYPPLARSGGLPSRRTVDDAEVEAASAVLTDDAAARSPVGCPWGRSDLDGPGLYAWSVDSTGARQLSAGLGLAVPPGLVYAGQAGATAWPTGGRSSSPLRSRIGGNHLGGRISASTWRKTLAATLALPLQLEVVGGELTPPSHRVLTQWMGPHLRLTVHPASDRDALGALEHAVLARLDPPLNLAGMPRTPLRARLSALRASLEVGSTTARADVT